MDNKKKQHLKLTRIFGLVAATPDGQVVLSRSGLDLAPVLACVAAGVAPDALFTLHPGIKPEEIKVAQAYLTRFGPDPYHPRGLLPGPKAILLDENVPYTLLPNVTANFGISSHVEAEGLSRQNLAPQHQRVHPKALDTLICTYAGQEQFAAIVTQDSDFIAMTRQPDHPVHNLHVLLIGKGVPSIEDCLKKHKPAIDQIIAQRRPGLSILG